MTSRQLLANAAERWQGPMAQHLHGALVALVVACLASFALGKRGHTDTHAPAAATSASAALATSWALGMGSRWFGADQLGAGIVLLPLTDGRARATAEEDVVCDENDDCDWVSQSLLSCSTCSCACPGATLRCQWLTHSDAFLLGRTVPGLRRGRARRGVHLLGLCSLVGHPPFPRHPLPPLDQVRTNRGLICRRATLSESVIRPSSALLYSSSMQLHRWLKWAKGGPKKRLG